MSWRTLIEINHDYLHHFCSPGALCDFMASLGGTRHRPPEGIKVLATRHHADPEFMDDAALLAEALRKVRDDYRATGLLASADWVDSILSRTREWGKPKDERAVLREGTSK